MELEAVDVISLVLSLCTACIHGTGLLLLFRRKSIVSKHAEIFSIALSTVLSTLIMHVRILTARYLNDQFIDWFLYALFNSFTIPFYGSMIILTLQRYFAIRLHLRFQDSWANLKRIPAVIFTWLITFVFLITTIVWLILSGPNPIWQHVIWVQGSIGPVLTNFIFIGVYIYIYIKYRKARNTRELFKKKRRIFTPFIICFSFLIFGTLPHFFQYKVKKLSYSIIWFSLDGITNSVVYLFLNKRLVVHFKRRRNTICGRPKGSRAKTIELKSIPSASNINHPIALKL